MRITEVFKTETEEDRRKAITELLIKIEAKKPERIEVKEQLKTG